MKNHDFSIPQSYASTVNNGACPMNYTYIAEKSNGHMEDDECLIHKYSMYFISNGMKFLYL